MILPIRAFGDNVLRKKAHDIEKDYPELQTLIDNMFETMYGANGIGLAAPQIGLDIRLFVVDVSPLSEDEDYEDIADDLKDFKKGLCFDYNTSGKKLLTYNDEQPDLTVTDYQDHKTKISQKYGINLAPTEYNLGISIDYETYINDTLHYGGF